MSEVTDLKEERRATKPYRDEMYHIRRSVKYHDHRKQFFESLVNWSLLLAVASGPMFWVFSAYFGTGAESGENPNQWLKFAPGVITSTFTGMVLITKASSKANLHDRLRVEFMRLRQDFERMPLEDRTDVLKVADFTARRVTIEEEELPINRVVDAMCHNEVCLSMGMKKPSTYLKLRFWHRWFGAFTHLFNEGPRHYRDDEDGPKWLTWENRTT